MLVISHGFNFVDSEYSPILLTLNILRLLWWWRGLVWLCRSGWLVGRKHGGPLLSHLPWINFTQFLASTFLASKFLASKHGPNHKVVGWVKNWNWDAFSLLGIHSVFLATLQLYQISELFQIDLNISQLDNFQRSIFNRKMVSQRWWSDCYQECQTGQHWHNPRWKRSADQLCQNSRLQMSSQLSPPSPDSCHD